MKQDILSQLDINEVCHRLSNLRGQDAKDEGTKALLRTLREEFRDASGTLNNSALDDAFNGIIKLDSGVVEVQGMISEILNKVGGGFGPRELSFHPACNALYSRLNEGFVPDSPTSWMGMDLPIDGYIYDGHMEF